MRDLLGVFVVFVGFVLPTSAAAAGQRPIASFELSQLLPAGSATMTNWTVTFVSDSSIAVGLCRGYDETSCCLSLLQWEKGTLRPIAATRDFRRTNMNLHRSAGNKILAMPTGKSPTILYSANLSATWELKPLHYVSHSGETLGESTKDKWELYGVDPQLHLVRSGRGSLRSASDQVVMFKDGISMRVESLGGGPLGYFSVPSDSKCYNSAGIASDGRLYLDTCKDIRIVDFDGNTELILQQPKGDCERWFQFDRWSTDGKRLLFDCTSRKVSFFRNLGEVMLVFATLGMAVGEEYDNREEIRAVDTTSGAICFDLNRKFPMGTESRLTRTAAISPSGALVAIAADRILSLYQLPTVCGGN